MHRVAEAVLHHETVARQNPLLGLVEIFEPHCQIAVADRAPIPAIDAYLAAVSDQLGAGFRLTIRPGERLPSHLLPSHSGREALIDDMTYLAEVYGDLLGCPAIGLRLEVLGRAMCPRFHVDHTGIRLVCTYRGPGTEWLEDSCADRSKLGPVNAGIPDAQSGIIRDAAGIHQVAPFAVTLLKGAIWQGNAGGGVIHRSPDIPPNRVPRILLAMDAIW